MRSIARPSLSWGGDGSLLAAEILWPDRLQDLRQPYAGRRFDRLRRLHGCDRRRCGPRRGRVGLSQGVFPGGPRREQPDVHTPGLGEGIRAWLLASSQRDLAHRDRSHLTQLDVVMLNEIAHHGVHAFAGKLAIVSIVAPDIGEALELEDRIGVLREYLGHRVELAGVLAPDFSLPRVEVDESRLH